MSSGYETQFVSKRVADRIYENPELAMEVLGELRANPRPNTEARIAYEEKYSENYREFNDLHSFLGDVITDLKVYEAINIPQEAQDASRADPDQQKIVDSLRRKIIRPDERDDREKVVILSARANELLAMARIALQHSQTQTELKDA